MARTTQRSLRWPLALGMLGMVICQATAAEYRVLRPGAEVEQWKPIPLAVEFASDAAADETSEAVEFDLVVTTPSGAELVVPTYASSGRRFACRFTPREAGDYTVSLPGQEGADSDGDAVAYFSVKPSEGGKGFLHLVGANPHVMAFDNGEQFRGIGSNVGWEPRRRRNQRHTYDALFERLSDHGANTVRTWSCPWNLPIEWGAPRLGEYNEEGLDRLDEMLALAERHGIYVILVLGYHGELQTESGYFANNDRWKDNPYNAANGGPCKTPADFFTSEEAKALYKQRLRMLAARVACHPNLLAWEFWNEVDHFQRRGPVPGRAITEWHAEMADYLHRLDVYGRPITTSISVEAPRGLWEDEGIDFISLHPYGKTDKFVRLLSEANARYNKPAVAAEFSYSWKPVQKGEAKLFERELRLGLWRGLMSPTPILPMTWWWEFHDSRDDWRQLLPVAAFSRRMTLLDCEMWRPLAVKADHIQVEANAVTLGDTVFLWVYNSSSDPIKDCSVRFKERAAKNYQVEYLNSTGDFEKIAKAGVGADGEDLVLIIPLLSSGRDAAYVLQP